MNEPLFTVLCFSGPSPQALIPYIDSDRAVLRPRGAGVGGRFDFALAARAARIAGVGCRYPFGRSILYI